MAALIFEDNTEDTKDHLFASYSSVCLVDNSMNLIIQFIGIPL